MLNVNNMDRKKNLILNVVCTMIKREKKLTLNDYVDAKIILSVLRSV